MISTEKKKPESVFVINIYSIWTTSIDKACYKTFRRTPHKHTDVNIEYERSTRLDKGCHQLK